ncbi:MAG: ATP-dependent helicase [Myxococcales bacterium]|nr:ATP-dependent helicase [Myxococcales bacterium]
MTAPTWQRLQREARAERRRPEGSAAAPMAAPIARAVEVALPAAVVDPAAIAARLAAVAAVSPRLHARLAALDPMQQAAVLADDRAALVRAAVGSGKTTVLVHKAAYLHVALGVPLAELAIVTFTTKAADELRARLDELLGRSTTPAERWLIGTFHAVALAMLQRVLPVAELGYRPDVAVLDEDGVAALLDELIATHKLRVGQRRRLREKLKALGPGGGSGDLARLAALVGEAKRARNAMDFDDLIDHACALLATADVRRPRWILIDELQDCEPRELELVRRLRAPDGGVFGVGDPRQAIYGWRGGVADGFARAATALGCVIHELPASYRSTATILDGARAVLGAQPMSDGALRAVRPPGAPIVVRRHHDPVAEATYLAARLAALHADGVPRAEVAVLCRLRAQVAAAAEALAAAGVPCAVDDGAAGIVAAPAPADAVRVLTLHAAKGLEFRHVFIAGANLGVVPLVVRDMVEDEPEERRLLFVGITRAKDEVEISYVACPHQFGALGAPSPLLYLLPATVVAWHDATAPAVPAPAPAPTSIAASVDAAPTPAPAAEPAAPWHAGQAVRHPRYGAGVVVEVVGDTVACAFGKLGARTFPLAMCPLVAAAGAAP